jgi:2-dehydropantoate 2-reductase
MTPPTTTLNIAVFGIGAMGTLFGSRLSSFANVTLVGNWREQIETIRRDGLTVTYPDGRRFNYSLSITHNPDELPPADVALILVKSHQTACVAQRAAQILRPDGIAITLQNGLGNLEQLIEAVGPARAGLGVTAQGATVLGPGQLYHAGQGPTHLASARTSSDKRLEAVAVLFNLAGLETTLVANADSLLWGKLAINAGINPLAALLELPNGMLPEDKTVRWVMSAAANEVAQVAAAQGIKLPFADAAKRTAEVCRATAGNRSSMLQDVSRTAPTEIEAICGAVVTFGKRLGVPTPVNEFLLGLVKAKEAGHTFDPQQLKLVAV